LETRVLKKSLNSSRQPEGGSFSADTPQGGNCLGRATHQTGPGRKKKKNKTQTNFGKAAPHPKHPTLIL